VNRLEDSIILWKSVVSNKLLAAVNIVLFLNKCDLLQRKLSAGVRLNQYMTSYGDRPNDFDAVSKCACARILCARALTRAQTFGTSLARSTRRTRRTRSASCTVSARALAADVR
jgi:hypothetical protein